MTCTVTLLEIAAVLLMNAALVVSEFPASGFNVRPETPAPEFLPSPLNVTFRRGEMAVLRCSVYNLGTKTVVWRRQEHSFPLTSGTMTVVADDRIQIGHVDFKNQWDLMIKNVKPEDEGVYVCQVASTNRNIRRMISLTVIDSITEATEISISEEQYVERGEPVALHCNVTGQHYTPDEIDWFRNGEKVTSEKRRGVKLLKHLSIVHRTFSSILSIDTATMGDSGVYVCRSSNMQIANTKVHVLNAETSNKKRGTYRDGQVSNGQKSSTSNIRQPIFAFICLCYLPMFKHFFM
ncbi:leucine-rich repeats and immunoglobulin-like domains protein 2 [Dreissena polymorpha]|uniref:leucine-rich repeats and immunoglobulin-like domains protein 2 n=1 Tax=Dreissena polymorpha TaxID=45954 RepID=UPI002264FE7E|nr:leucine-rich repeats and immunoglobulin-like domains protein 2 [Dreissena polymorpha]